MFPEFNFDRPESLNSGEQQTTLSPETSALLDEYLKRRLKPAEHNRLERLLLDRLKEKKPELQEMLEVMSNSSNYEDCFYRYYHGSFKVYAIQTVTEKSVKALRDLLPERSLNLIFEKIIKQGTGKTFEMEHNGDWDFHTRPMLEAFSHAKYMIEMAVRYADLTEPPQPMPSGYAALLYLFELR